MRKAILAIALAIAALFTVLSATNASASTHPKPPANMPHGMKFITYYVFEASDLNADLFGCVDDPNNGGSGTKLQYWSCNGRIQQQYYLAQYADDPTGVYRIVGENGLCVDDTNGGGNGTHVQVYTCADGYHNQRWRLGYYGSVNYWRSDPVSGNPAIDLTNDSHTNGNPIQMWNWLQDNAQMWYGPFLG